MTKYLHYAPVSLSSKKDGRTELVTFPMDDKLLFEDHEELTKHE